MNHGDKGNNLSSFFRAYQKFITKKRHCFKKGVNVNKLFKFLIMF